MSKSNRNEGLIQTRNTRTGDPRKIDEWTVRLPGGDKAIFDIMLRYDGDESCFSIATKHPDFKDLKAVSPEMVGLRRILELEVREVISGRLAEGWTPARVIEVRHKRYERPGNAALSLAIDLKDCEYRPDEPVGNRGETRIRTEHRQETVVQRAHEDDFSDIEPKSGLMTDPEVIAYFNSPLRNEVDARVSRIISEEQEKATLLLDALERFSTLLADRLSPTSVSMGGFPEMREMIVMMESACSDPAPSDDEHRP